MAIAIMNAAKTIAKALFCLSSISFHRFSGVTRSIIQKEMKSTTIPMNEYTIDAIMYFMLTSSYKLMIFLFMVKSIYVSRPASSAIVFCVLFNFIIVEGITMP